jgi:hypothetical protein
MRAMERKKPGRWRKMEKENKTGRNMRKRRSIRRRGRREGKDEIAKRDSGIKEMQERNLKKEEEEKGSI